jgi:hypothetical protein
MSGSAWSSQSRRVTLRRAATKLRDEIVVGALGNYLPLGAKFFLRRGGVCLI